MSNTFYDGNFSADYGNFGAGYLIATRFKPDKDIIISQLGMKLFSDHPGITGIDIWNNSGGLVARATTPYGVTGWQWLNITPVTLYANQYYKIGVWSSWRDSTVKLCKGAGANTVYTVGGVNFTWENGNYYDNGTTDPANSQYPTNPSNFSNDGYLYTHGFVFDLANAAPTSPTSLLCEGLTNPTYVNKNTPKFSSIFQDPDSGNTTSQLEIQVGSSSGASDKWDSGVINISSIGIGSRCQDVSYAGSALASRTTYFWRCRFTDNNGAVGAWSAEQTFKTGWLHKFLGVQNPAKVLGIQASKVLGVS